MVKVFSHRGTGLGLGGQLWLTISSRLGTYIQTTDIQFKKQYLKYNVTHCSKISKVLAKQRENAIGLAKKIPLLIGLYPWYWKWWSQFKSCQKGLVGCQNFGKKDIPAYTCWKYHVNISDINYFSLSFTTEITKHMSTILQPSKLNHITIYLQDTSPPPLNTPWLSHNICHWRIAMVMKVKMGVN